MIEWVGFAFACVIGLYLSAKDAASGIIPNKGIALLLLGGIALKAFSMPPLPQTAAILAYGLVISFTLWFTGIWPAGDAKLFFALLWFFPWQFYLLAPQNLMLAFLTNVFVPIFFFFCFLIFFKSKKAAFLDAIKFSFEPYKVVMLAIIYFGFTWLVLRGAQILLGLNPDYFVSLLLMFLAFEALSRTVSAKIEFFFIGCALLRAILDFGSFLLAGFWAGFAITLLVFIFFRFFVLYLAFKIYTKSVKIENLEEGMNPAEGIAKKGEKFEKISFLQPSMINFMSQRKLKYIHNLHNFTKKDVEKIKALRKEGKIPFDEVLISQTQQFAIFIFAGFAITFFLSRDFVSFLFLLARGL